MFVSICGGLGQFYFVTENWRKITTARPNFSFPIKPNGKD